MPLRSTIWKILVVVLFLLSAVLALSARSEDPEIVFHSDQRDTLKPPWVRPSHVIKMDHAYSGQWLVAGDLDGDEQVEFLSARNDEQVITAMSAYKLDGRVLWRWGRPSSGSALFGYDVPAQIYDVDGNGSREVIFSVQGFLVFAEGATGREIWRMPLPENLRVADCIVFANLTGRKRAEDLIIKDRYERIWAFERDSRTQAGNPFYRRLLWRIETPGGFKTCHHPERVDIDGDGRDEVMVGYALADDDGDILWTLQSARADLQRGHLDCCRLVRRGKRPEGFRFVLTYCGAKAVAVVDGTGRTLWELTSHHFESADVGDVRPDIAGPEIVVDIDHQPYGNSPTWILSEDGRLLGTYLTNYGRHHDLVDWNGDGIDEIIFGHARALCDGRGQRLATFAPDSSDLILTPEGSGDPEPFVLVGDVTGDGREDVILHSAEQIEIYANPSPQPPRHPVRIGSGLNFTLY